MADHTPAIPTTGRDRLFAVPITRYGSFALCTPGMRADMEQMNAEQREVWMAKLAAATDASSNCDQVERDASALLLTAVSELLAWDAVERARRGMDHA